MSKIALIGLGAIGTVYGRLLHEKYADNFAVIAGGERGERLKANGAAQNGKRFYPRVIIPQQKDFKADLILVCVKNYQLSQAIEDLRGAAENGRTVILPLLNGITAKDRLSDAFPGCRVLYGLSIYIDAVRSEGGVKNTSDGLIQLGDASNTPPFPEVTAAAGLLSEAGIKTQICPDMMRAIWKKWMLNVGCNQVSAVTGATYGLLANIETNRILFHEAMMEVVALAEASGIDLTEKDALEMEEMMSSFSPEGKTSMLQDMEAKRRTEVDYFAGTAVELGKKLHVPTPVSHVLGCVIKSIEQKNKPAGHP